MHLLKDYTIALSHLYGIVHKEKVVQIYNMQNEIQIDTSDIDRLIENEQELVEKHFVYVEGNYFVHETILVFDDFDHYMKEKAGKPYYIPDQEELLKYTDQFYFEETQAYRNVLKYVVKEFTQGDRERAVEICEDIVGFCEIEATPGEIINNISGFMEFKSEKQMGELIDLVVDVANNTRIWSNNGHTPKELFEMYEKPHLSQLQANPDKSGSKKGRKKIGRNAPCPCGSGKKYKRCCLE